MLFHYVISKPTGPICFALSLLAGSIALAQGKVTQETPESDPPAETVTCGWDGFATLTDANCTQTQQRRVLTCSDGTQRVGQCVV